MWNPQRKAPVKWTGNAARELAHRVLADNGGRACFISEVSEVSEVHPYGRG